MESYTLSNGVKIPKLILGVPMIAEAANVTEDLFVKTINNAISIGFRGFDTSHDYGKSEPLLGQVFNENIGRNIDRESIFINTKIGNGQQMDGNIEKYVDEALTRLKVDYLDAMLLHWPVPDVYVKNWEKLIKVYESGKVKSIGIANAKVRHIKKIEDAGMMLPHILQTEIHPLHTSEAEREYCRTHGIQVEACTPLCCMLPIIRNNKVLCNIASIHNVTLPQVVLRWHIQHNIAPVFRSFNKEHLRQMADVFSFELSQSEMKEIDSQNINYRYHPESINCPGF